MNLNVRRHAHILLRPNARRVLLRPFYPSSDAHARRLVDRLLTLNPEQESACLDRLAAEFLGRHPEPRAFVLKRSENIRKKLNLTMPLRLEQQLLLGACFTHEYACESTALFNPSIVWHPDQSGVSAGSRRFILSLRAVGEGHVSSIAFRSGSVDAAGNVALDEASPWVETGRLHIDRLSGPCDEFDPAMPEYEISYVEQSAISQRILFPVSLLERNGIEDARFVRFHTDDGAARYYATYTAYDGQRTRPHLLETADFVHFRIVSLAGEAAVEKGMALFPRPINGHFAMLGRQTHERIDLMYSDSLHTWQHRQALLAPRFPWEMIQLGNCGSPIETEAGWLVLTHGVGAMRKYCIGAALLDRQDPSKVIGRLPEPLLSAENEEREGYVPNVVYTCGAIVHQDQLVLPYAMSDYATSFATVELAPLLQALQSSGLHTERS